MNNNEYEILSTNRQEVICSVQNLQMAMAIAKFKANTHKETFHIRQVNELRENTGGYGILFRPANSIIASIYPHRSI